MTWEIVFVLALLAATFVGFWLEKVPPDQVAVVAFAVLVGAAALPGAETLPSVGELLSVFANPAPLTIAGMFILSAALEQCGTIDKLAASLGGLTRFGFRPFLFVLVLAVAGVSAFINNTPVVMVFLPVVFTLARKLRVSPSKILIPLSYASIFGGTCTLVGTSTNILASGILERAGRPPIGMFELTGLGLPLVFGGAVYLFFFAQRLLPDRESLTALLSPEERKEFIVEAFVQPGSPIAGMSIAESRLPKEQAVRVLEIIRGEVALEVDPQTTRLEDGDRLILACRPSGIAHATSIVGLELTDSRGVGLETISAHEGYIVEGIVPPASSIIGRTIQEINFRQRFRVVLLAIHRRGINLRREMESVRLQSGDILLMMGTDTAIAQLRQSDDVYLLDHPRTPASSAQRRAPLVLATVAAVIAAAALDLLPIVAAVMIGIAVIFVTGSLKAKDGYANIEWSILVLIYGMLAVGQAMESTGAATLVARGLSSVAGLGFIPVDWRPHVVLALLYLVTSILTETLSNNATIVLMTPIALSLGVTMGVDPRPLVIAACFAASASFSTPIGYQTNTYVYGVGGYRFTDFARIGVPLNLLYFVVCVIMVPVIWRF